MKKNKKILAVLSTAAISGLMAVSVNSTVFAKASTIAVNSKDGKVYEYQYDALKTSAVSQINAGSTDPGAKLYNDFLQRKTTIRAFYDDVRKSYVDFDTISKEAATKIANGASFDFKSFMESTTTPTTSITTTPVYIDGNGNLSINGQVVTESVDMATIKCSNPVDNLSTLVSFRLSVADPEHYIVTVKGKTASLDFTTGNFTTYVDGKVLAADIKASDFTINKRISSDKPTVKSVTIIDSQTIRVTFSKDVDYAYASNISNYKLLDSSGIDITNHIRGIYGTISESDTSNTDTFMIRLQKCNPNNANEDWRLTASKYTLTINNIIDTSAIPNSMDDYSCVLNSNDADTTAPKGTGIYANLRTSTDKDKVIVYFSEAMDAATLTNKDNYKFVNGEGDTKSLPADPTMGDTTISVGGDDKSAIIEFPSNYHVLTTGRTTTGKATDITALVVSNVKDGAGNVLDGVAYNNYNKINAPVAGTNVRDNTIKTYYDGDDLKVSVQFTRALDEISAKDFTLGGVTPNSATISGDKVTLTFKDSTLATASEIAAHPITYANGKTNTSPTKIAVIKSQGQNAKLAINSTGTIDETGAKVSINDNGSPATLSNAQSSIYDYQASPRTTCYDDDTVDFWTATKDTNGVSVYITFDTPLDTNSGIKTDDFSFVGANGTDIKADSVSITGNTVVFKFNTTNKDYSVLTDSVDIRIKSTVSLRTVKDLDGNNALYLPSSDDLRRRVVKISR